MKVVSWNIAGKPKPWHVLAGMDADIGLLQEATSPPADVEAKTCVDPAPWRAPRGGGEWSRRTAIARLSDRVGVKWIDAAPLVEARSDEFAVSRPGTLTAASVTAPGIEPFVVVSMYSLWAEPHASTHSGWIVSDASAHRLVSDLSMFIGSQHGHRIVAAGDLNILHGYGEHGSAYWASRYATVFDRMEALGLAFVGPQHPHGRQAEPWPDELPPDSLNVPTFQSTQQTPESATRQLDFVFASRGMADSVHVRALNEPQEWGPSDHCRVEIEIT